MTLARKGLAAGAVCNCVETALRLQPMQHGNVSTLAEYARIKRKIRDQKITKERVGERMVASFWTDFVGELNYFRPAGVRTRATPR